MLNNRLEDLIYKYNIYKIKLLLKRGSIVVLFFLISFSLYSIYNKYKSIKNTPKKQVIKEIKTTTTKKSTIIKIKEKNKINEEDILTKNSLKTLTLIEKNKPTYQSAMDLANYYFEKKEYQKAAKWAMTATNRDPKKDGAWLVYAKAKIKLKQIGMAKKALRIYLIKYHSQKVTNLLNSI